jgi:hypothetical protein
MKYDGSPSLVFGHHPETGKFFVASKSAFNKNPKINYTPEDIEANHGHAPGLVAKLKSALTHLPKVVPHHGVYQGDVMYTSSDVSHNSDGSASFTPNTITYTAHGQNSDKVKASKFGVVVHTRYHGSSLDDMRANSDVDIGSFNQKHPDVFIHSAEHDTNKANYTPEQQHLVMKHLKAAESIHDVFGKSMYRTTSKHHGGANHLATYINSTVRNDEVPTVDGFMKHIHEKLQKDIDKVKTDKSKQKKTTELNDHLNHISDNKEHYQNLFTMHHHLQQAKNHLVTALESHEGEYTHSINGAPTKPEGFVINDNGTPTKLVNRSEFARQNFLRSKNR